MDEVLTLSARAQAARIAGGELSAEALMRATLERVREVNGALNAIVSLRDEADLLEEARRADAEPARGALHGLPVAVKDLSNVAGLPTSKGSPALAGQIAASDDLHVARMRAAGAIVIGKTNTPEFGLGSHTFNPVHGVTCNPYEKTRSCGGSSGGAAVALAARMLSIADGSDMMGSLRNPAGWNNVYGMRPSWGLVPGEPAGDTFLHQLSTLGPMARDPGDLALLLGVMAGPDARQAHGVAAPDLTPDPAAKIAGRRIGWLGDWGGAFAMEAGIMDLGRAACAVFEELGCVVEDVAPPFSRDALWESWTALRSWSVACNLSPLLESPETRDRLKPDAIWEIERGRAMSGLDVHRASVIRSQWFTRAAELFDRYDALVMPTAQVWPFPLEWAWPREIAGQAMDSYHRWMEVVVPASLAGLPALAVPAGFGVGGLPMGVQLIGRRGADRGLLDLGQAYHEATRWPERNPVES
ncbi:amidase [Roseovarius halotolerans]|uniref:Acylamidase n=1 Tax=Roseovarius halotolerans TaxID=505353 RepID=A0A1X6YM00_9RHOB|nr:amidase [Roseovarius halotolerans]RKT34360.1 amidase [Roseovarius halotolerans]SLN24447.1 Acylamidase [Roseovarius halotolerans]